VTLSPTENSEFPKSLGYAGLLPFVGLALLVHLWGAHQGFLRHALLAYGACIVSFVGAVHWGIGISASRRSRSSVAWSVLPALAAWVALSIDRPGSFVAMAVILVVCLAVDTRFHTAGDLPHWYLKMRVALTTIGALSLTAGAV
jgi:hypothetical protein